VLILELEAYKLPEKSILITGCSSGIGLAAASSLKQKGYRVFASARQAEDVEKLSQLGLETIKLDVTDTSSMQQALTHILEKTGGTLYALFNNAGYLQAGAIEDLSRDQHRAQFETNVFGPMELIRLILPIMRKQGYGRIIQNSSILGIITLPFYGAYNASKFALEGYTNTLRQELRGTNIHVSNINPGAILSDLRDNAFQLYQTSGIHKESSPFKHFYQKMEKHYFVRKDKRSYGQSPEAVVTYLIHALESSRPRAHYYVGFSAKIMAFLRRLLPDCALDWIASKVN